MSFRKRVKKYAEKEKCTVLTSLGPVNFWLQRSHYRRKTIEVRITDSLEVQVTAPGDIDKNDVDAFVCQKASWIFRTLQGQKDAGVFLQSRHYKHGHKFLFLGEYYPLTIAKASVRRPRLSFDGLKWHVKVPAGRDHEKDVQLLVKNKLIAWYKMQAKEILGTRVFYYARLLGLHPQKIGVKTQKRLWGSCGFKKRSVYLNWQLVLSPLAVMDYVIVHELSHLKFPSHSKRFWKNVENIFPDYKARQKWLLTHRLEMVLP